VSGLFPGPQLIQSIVDFLDLILEVSSWTVLRAITIERACVTHSPGAKQ
jgi:hypothetical protein